MPRGPYLTTLTADTNHYPMKLLSTLSILLSVLVFTPSAGQKNEAAQKSAAGRIEIREAGAGALRITLLPEGYGEGLPYTPALAEREYPAPALTAGPDFTPDTRKLGNLTAEVLSDPHIEIVDDQPFTVLGLRCRSKRIIDPLLERIGKQWTKGRFQFSSQFLFLGSHRMLILPQFAL